MKQLGSGTFRPRARDGLAGFAMPARPLRIALVTPRFGDTYYGFTHALPIIFGRPMAAMPVGSLPLLAALVPAPHEVEIFDDGLVPVDIERLRTFDIIGLTGMITQNERMFEILAALRDFSGLLLVGGPYASISEDSFTGSCDAIFVGEADETWPAFLAAVIAGEPFALRHEQAERTDLTRLPEPRYDLVRARDYASVPIQFSRGCPFLCEFCDIITVFGRRPRTKTPDQVIAELATVARQGFRSVFLVDDNFIGNKKAAKELLKAVVVWQQANGYPVTIATEASLNLAEEPELMELMREANVFSVFIGIESASAASLLETRKVQNARGDSIRARIDRIRDHGIFVTGGFIIGFDNDGPDVFDVQEAFINELRIAESAIGTLIALPGTPLYERLEREGRLRPEQPSCNFVPAQMTVDELIDGTLRTNRAIFEPEVYFERFFGATAGSARLVEIVEARRGAFRSASPWRRLAVKANALLVGARFARALGREGELRHLGGRYLQIYRARGRHAGAASMPAAEFLVAAIKHWHRYKLYKDMAGGRGFVSGYAFTEHQKLAA